MDAHRLFDELLAAARRLQLDVRVEPLLARSSSGGGLCKVGGRTLVVIDENAPLPDRSAALAKALGHFDLETIYLPPEVRRFIRRGTAVEPGSASLRGIHRARPRAQKAGDEE